MPKQIKIWIVRKLGGMFWADLPTDIQQILLNRSAIYTMDYHIRSMLENGNETSYTNKL